MLEFAGVIKNLDQANLRTYQIEVKRDTRGGSDVLIPRITGNNMQAILAVFKGQAPLLEAPAHTTDLPTTTQTGGATTGTATGPTTDTAAPAQQPAGGDGAEENVRGIVPPKNVGC